MRLHVWFLPLAAAAIAFLGSAPRYTPAAAIGYADNHWRWAVGTGCPGLVINGPQQLRRREVPGPGWFQPDFECAEFVGRALHAGGIPVPVVPESDPAWPNLVNVDRLAYWLLSRGWAIPTTVRRLQPGDVAIFRYARAGQPASPNVWQHMALVVGQRPLLLDAHNRARYHASWPSLSRTAYQVQALHILRLRKLRPSPGAKPLPPESQVQIAWRDVWTSAQVHLYWGQSYRVRAATTATVVLDGVRGTLPRQAVVRVPRTPQVSVQGQFRVVLGISPGGQPIVSTPDSPIPAWTGHSSLVQSSLPAPGWALIKPQAVQTVRAAAIEPLPRACALPADFAPRGAVMVMDAQVKRRWAQVLWPGSPTGLGFVPLTQLHAAPGLTVGRTRQRVFILLGSGRTASLSGNHIWIRVGCHVYYGGVLRPWKSCPKSRTRLP